MPSNMGLNSIKIYIKTITSFVGMLSSIIPCAKYGTISLRHNFSLLNCLFAYKKTPLLVDTGTKGSELALNLLKEYCLLWELISGDS